MSINLSDKKDGMGYYYGNVNLFGETRQVNMKYIKRGQYAIYLGNLDLGDKFTSSEKAKQAVEITLKNCLQVDHIDDETIYFSMPDGRSLQYSRNEIDNDLHVYDIVSLNFEVI